MRCKTTTTFCCLFECTSHGLIREGRWKALHHTYIVYGGKEMVHLSNFHLPPDFEEFFAFYCCIFVVVGYCLLKFVHNAVDHFTPLIYNYVLHQWPFKDYIKKGPKVGFDIRPYRECDGPQIRKIWTSGFLDMCNDATFSLGGLDRFTFLALEHYVFINSLICSLSYTCRVVIHYGHYPFIP